MEYFFRKIKKIYKRCRSAILSYFRTQYWYHFRKVPTFWFDPEKGKYIERKEDNRAQLHLNTYWSGEKDFLGILLLKIEYAYYQLKKRGWQSYFYVDAGKFFEEGATGKDRSAFVRQIIERCEAHPEEYKHAWWFERKEFWTDKDWTTTVEKKSRKFNQSIGYENAWWIGSIPTASSKGNGNTCYYLYKNLTSDGWGWTETWGIKSIVKVPGCPIKEINITYFPSCYGFSDIQKIVDEKGIEINVLQNFLLGPQTMDVSDMKVYSKLSPYIKSVARGRRKVLTDLLNFRHLVKSLMKLTVDDDKYSTIWYNRDLKGDPEFSDKLMEAYELYKTDRKELYKKLFDFVIDNGLEWGD